MNNVNTHEALPANLKEFLITAIYVEADEVVQITEMTYHGMRLGEATVIANNWFKAANSVTVEELT